MRWTECHICGVEDDETRPDRTFAKVYECWSCWQDYCERDGYIATRICNHCLDEAYQENTKRKGEV